MVQLIPLQEMMGFWMVVASAGLHMVQLMPLQEMMGFWMVVASAGPYANNLHLTLTDNRTKTSSVNFFIDWMLFPTPNQQCQSTEITSTAGTKRKNALNSTFWVKCYKKC